MIIRNHLIKISIVSSILYANPVSANVLIKDNAPTKSMIIYGEISKNDVTTIKDNINRIQNIDLMSNGGDIEAALDIGEIIYKTEYTLHLLIDEKRVNYKHYPIVRTIGGSTNGEYVPLLSTQKTPICSSACVLIYASARIRYTSLDNSLAIHNPYSTSIDGNYDDFKSNRDRLKNRAIKQFERVGVSPLLWSLMESIPSEKLRPLDNKEMTDLGLSNDDPTYQDYKYSFEALTFGITKQEYIYRLNLEKSCKETINLNQNFHSNKETLTYINDRRDSCTENAKLSYKYRRKIKKLD
jgi:hypothetical protein